MHGPSPRLRGFVLLLLGGCGGPLAVPPNADVASTLQGGPARAGYAVADQVRVFSFPADHGPHPDFRIEWWYFTGHLEARNGRRFGYQLTFFRSALAPPGAPTEPPRASAWATRQAYLAHFAVSDLDGERFYADSRLARGAADLAGARAGSAEAPFRTWVGPWEAASETTHDLLPLRLRAEQHSAAIDLRLTTGKPLVLHGDRGLSQKGTGEANASYYYSLTRLPTTGLLTLGNESFEVTGDSWFDREWSTSALSSEQVGWDWFSLQLDDGREVMFFALRRKDGTLDPKTSATVVEADGTARSLRPGPAALSPSGAWRSPRSGGVYPNRWRLQLPEAGLDLTIVPRIADQELAVGFTYWEGATAVVGTSAGRPVRGRGYVELTGYAEAGGSPGH